MSIKGSFKKYKQTILKTEKMHRLVIENINTPSTILLKMIDTA